MDSTKKSRKKKNATDDDYATEDLLGKPGGEDDSDNEEIENMLDATDAAFEKDGDYDYDDPDQVADDDDDLVGGAIDNESNLPDGEDVDDMEAELNDDDEPIVVGNEDEEADPIQASGKRKRKGGKTTGASPFASPNDYQHLLNDAGSPAERERSSGRKKKKSA